MADGTTPVGDVMLDIFRAYGVEFIFSSPGSEYAPLWDSLAHAAIEGKGPALLDLRHEDSAVAAATGYYFQTGKLPVVALHTGVGTIHAGLALRNASHLHAPMVVMAGCSASYGESPVDAGGQWRSLSDSVGPEGMARPLVKRSSAVTAREILPGMLQDACRLALTPPFGPVFLAVPFEHMYGYCAPFTGQVTPPPPPTHADKGYLERVAEQLIRAQRPVLVTGHAGRDKRNVALLVELAESLAMPVIESATFMNFPRDHALHQGFMAGGDLLQQADLVLLVGVESPPWYPASRRPKDAKVILVDDNPGQELDHFWGYSIDEVVAGEIHSSLQTLAACTKGAKLDRQSELASWRDRHDRQYEELRAQALQAATQRPMDGRFAAATLAQSLPSDAIVVGEVLSAGGPLQRLMRQREPGTYFNSFHGGLGVGLGFALGVKVGAPDRLVVNFEGDGAFSYNPIMASFGFAQQFGVPILSVVMNNKGYMAMRRLYLRYYPEGWGTRTGKFFGSDIAPLPDYAAVARAFGGYGERVEAPEDLQGAVQRAVERVAGGQLALLDLVVDPVENVK